MAGPLVYNIALAQLSAYADHTLVVRTDNAQALVDRLGPDQLEQLAYIQLCSLPADSSQLMHWGEDLSIEIALANPADDFPQLYRFAKLLDNHPVRVAIPVIEGFDKAVKLALSLQFSVRLQFGQPDAQLIGCLSRLLDAYLHQPTVSQPIEVFHNLLLAFCHQEPLNLWAAQEEDPALIRYVDNAGVEKLPGRLSQAEPGANPGTFVADWTAALIDEKAQCAGCEYVDYCQGYFKWPDRHYDCAGVKTLFQTLREAAGELRRDLAVAEKIES